MSEEELELQVEQVERLVRIARLPHVLPGVRDRCCINALEQAYGVLAVDPAARPWIASVVRELGPVPKLAGCR